MVSAWWLLAAFIVGGYAGILVVATMHFASREPQVGSIGVPSDGDFSSWLGRDQGHSAS